MVLKFGGGFNLYGSEGPVDWLREIEEVMIQRWIKSQLELGRIPSLEMQRRRERGQGFEVNPEGRWERVVSEALSKRHFEGWQEAYDRNLEISRENLEKRGEEIEEIWGELVTNYLQREKQKAETEGRIKQALKAKDEKKKMKRESQVRREGKKEKRTTYVTLAVVLIAAMMVKAAIKLGGGFNLYGSEGPQCEVCKKRVTRGEGAQRGAHYTADGMEVCRECFQEKRERRSI